MSKCQSGNCGILCKGDCVCMSITEDPDNCECYCFETLKPASKRTKTGKKILFMRYKRRINVNPQSRYNICVHNMPISTLAQSFDKVLPNRILVPANKLTKNITFGLKNKTFRQIIIACGLGLKN